MKLINSTQIIREILAQVKGLDCVKCEICLKTEHIHLHHIDKNRNNNKIANLILLCKECHRQAHGGSFGKNGAYKKETTEAEINKYISKEVEKFLKRNKKKIDKRIKFLKKDAEELRTREEQRKRLNSIV